MIGKGLFTNLWYVTPSEEKSLLRIKNNKEGKSILKLEISLLVLELSFHSKRRIFRQEIKQFHIPANDDLRSMSPIFFWLSTFIVLTENQMWNIFTSKFFEEPGSNFKYDIPISQNYLYNQNKSEFKDKSNTF